MTIQTKSQFFFVEPITLDNLFLDFSEGGPNIAIEIPVGARSPQTLLNIVSSNLNEFGTQDYVVSLNRVTNRVTISAPGNFELNGLTGPNVGQGTLKVLGFNLDFSGSSSYEADSDFVSIWKPQFLFQNYISPEQWTENVKATINESGDGTIETFSFGKKSFWQLNAKFVTNIPQGGVGSVIEEDLAGEENAQAFLLFAIDKTNMEIMLDRDDPNTFFTLFLESSPGNKEGLGYKLKEMISKGLAGYYETGNLVFRKVNI